jgi:ribosomal protein S18 acetylase RimI-like enzyme
MPENLGRSCSRPDQADDGVGMDKIDIRPFVREDQASARSLILTGLSERWGTLDESRNADLRDIAGAYETGVFLCAWEDGTLIGTGALLPRQGGVGEIVRMSVARAYRRRGVGRQIAIALLGEAGRRGFRRVILETTSTWTDAIRFYQGLGFAITHNLAGDTYLALDLVD